MYSPQQFADFYKLVSGHPSHVQMQSSEIQPAGVSVTLN